MTSYEPVSTVVKVGGSLLDWPELPDRLSGFLVSEAGRGEGTVLMAGGGKVVDVIRDLDRVHELGDVRSHVLAIHALDLSAEILVRLIPHARVVSTKSGILRCRLSGNVPIFAPRRLLLNTKTPRVRSLPTSWSMTSDSIAAWVAGWLGADRLILLKSADLPVGCTQTMAASTGLVDPLFSEFAQGLKRVDYRNLRDPTGRLDHLPSDRFL